MSTATLRLDIVSAEKQIFSGTVEMVFMNGEMGELGISPGHSQLLTTLRPGQIRAVMPNKEEELFYISGGMVEVQPYIVSVLADTAMRAHDIDEAAALAAKEQAENALSGKSSKIDITRATMELAEALAQISTIQKLRQRIKK
jgi:F-type H+-transporting ATPase subunit epsilon